jgi:hypothetical protein
MESFLFLADLLTGHELWVFGRARCARKRGRPRSPNAGGGSDALEEKRSRFVESFHRPKTK